MATESPSILHHDADTEQKIHAMRLTRRRWWLAGFGVGIILVFTITGIDFLIRGWRCLPFDFGCGMIIGPLWCATFAWGRCPVKANDLPKQRFQLHTADMMLWIGFFGLWLGLVVTTVPLGTKANTYRQHAINARAMTDLFQNLADKNKAEIKLRTDNIAKLRERKVPDGLLDIQRDFLRKLDAEGPPQLREERYRLITDGESRLLKNAMANEVTFRALMEYHNSLFTKYEEATNKPWIEVATDPGPPTALGVPMPTPPTPAIPPRPAPAETKRRPAAK